jgi:hypothetical protein
VAGAKCGKEMDPLMSESFVFLEVVGLHFTTASSVFVHRAKIYLWESELSSAPFHSVALDHHAGLHIYILLYLCMFAQTGALAAKKGMQVVEEHGSAQDISRIAW